MNITFNHWSIVQCLFSLALAWFFLVLQFIGHYARSCYQSRCTSPKRFLQLKDRTARSNLPVAQFFFLLEKNSTPFGFVVETPSTNLLRFLTTSYKIFNPCMTEVTQTRVFILMTTRYTCWAAIDIHAFSGYPTISVLILDKHKSIFKPQLLITHFFHKNTVGQNLSAQLYAIDDLHVRLTFNLGKTNKIFYYS